LLQKTLLNIEGLGRQLYPDLDLWQTAKPFLEPWMSEQVGTRALIKSLRTHMPQWAEIVPRLPTMIHNVLDQAQQGKLHIQWDSKELKEIKKYINRAHKRTYAAIVGGSLIVSATVLYGLDGYSPVMLGDAPLLTWVLGGLGAFILFSTWPNGNE